MKFQIAALEESQTKLQEKLAELEKGQTTAAAVTEETKDAPMEESEAEAPAAPAAVTEAAPEPEPTKEAEKTETPAETAAEEPKGE